MKQKAYCSFSDRNIETVLKYPTLYFDVSFDQSNCYHSAYSQRVVQCKTQHFQQAELK